MLRTLLELLLVPILMGVFKMQFSQWLDRKYFHKGVEKAHKDILNEVLSLKAEITSLRSELKQGGGEGSEDYKA